MDNINYVRYKFKSALLSQFIKKQPWEIKMSIPNERHWLRRLPLKIYYTDLQRVDSICLDSFDKDIVVQI